MKLKYLAYILLFALFSCEETTNQAEVETNELAAEATYSNFPKGKQSQDDILDIYHVMLEESEYTFKMPHLNSFAMGKADGNTWVVFGGKKNGYHGTDEQNSFLSRVANDSIWVIDLSTKQSWGVPVPSEYWNTLSCSNPQSYQLGNSLYFCGGFTRESASSTQSNWTSDLFLEFDINALISYVKNGGGDFSSAILKQLNDPFVQVTGGEMYANKDFIYLIGGQNYTGPYRGGVNGKYTNAVRRFGITSNESGGWKINDTLSLVDKENLHRRDLNVVEVFDKLGNVVPSIYGGVFTIDNLAFTNPVYIHGCESGNISISVDTSVSQKINLYKCASFPISCQGGCWTMVNLIGGISGYSWDSSTNSLIAGTPLAPGSGSTDPLPWSNMNGILWSTTNWTHEVLQLPTNGAELLPGYLGSDAKFIALDNMLLDGYPSFIDGNKLASQGDTITLGYMYGGVRSEGATTQWIPAEVRTDINKVLYEVKITRVKPD